MAISWKYRGPGALLVRLLLTLAVGCTGPNPRYRIPRGDAAATDAGAADGARDADPSDPTVEVAPPVDVPPIDAGSTETSPPADTRPPVDSGPPVETGPSPDAAGDAPADAPRACQPGCPGCSNGLCVDVPALAIYWAFDEATGTTALDSSGNNLHGTYRGEIGIPGPSPLVPPWPVAGKYSRAFTLENEHAVWVETVPVAVRAPNEVSVALWYRATRTDVDGTFLGSELVSLGDNLVLRLRSDFIEFAKQTGNPGPVFVQCRGSVPTARLLDGNWHHVVAVTRPTGMTVYFDGNMVGTNTNGSPIQYTQPLGLWVGRHADRSTSRFDGHIDEVRIYTTALSVAEIQWLSARGP